MTISDPTKEDEDEEEQEEAGDLFIYKLQYTHTQKSFPSLSLLPNKTKGYINKQTIMCFNVFDCLWLGFVCEDFYVCVFFGNQSCLPKTRRDRRAKM